MPAIHSLIECFFGKSSYVSSLNVLSTLFQTNPKSTMIIQSAQIFPFRLLTSSHSSPPACMQPKAWIVSIVWAGRVFSPFSQFFLDIQKV
jgi:hypothetical protein